MGDPEPARAHPRAGERHRRLRQLAVTRLDDEVFKELVGAGDEGRPADDDLVVAAALRAAARRYRESTGDGAALVDFVGRLTSRRAVPAQVAADPIARAYLAASIGWYEAAHDAYPLGELWTALDGLLEAGPDAASGRERLIGLIADIGCTRPLPERLEQAVMRFYRQPYLFQHPEPLSRVFACVLELNLRRSNFDFLLNDWLPRWCRCVGRAGASLRSVGVLLRHRDMHRRLGQWLPAEPRRKGGPGLLCRSLLLGLIRLDPAPLARWPWARSWLDRPWAWLIRSCLRGFGRSRFPPARPAAPHQSGIAAGGNADRPGLRIRTDAVPAAAPGDVLVTQMADDPAEVLAVRPALIRLARRRRGRVVLATNAAWFPAFSIDDPFDLVDIETAAIRPWSFRRWIDLSADARNRTRPAELLATGLRPAFSPFGHRAAFPIRFPADAIAAARGFVRDRAATGVLRVGIQVQAAENFRDVPALREVAQALAGRYNVFVFDGLPADADRFIAAGDRPLPVRLAMVLEMDAVIAPDSAVLHVAGSSGIPCLALFGPTDGKRCTASYASVRALDMRGMLACVPCGRSETEKCRLANGYESICLTAMTAPMIVFAFEEMIAAQPAPARASGVAARYAAARKAGASPG